MPVSAGEGSSEKTSRLLKGGRARLKTYMRERSSISEDCVRDPWAGSKRLILLVDYQPTRLVEWPAARQTKVNIRKTLTGSQVPSRGGVSKRGKLQLLPTRESIEKTPGPMLHVHLDA